MNPRCTARLATPLGRPAALAVIALRGDADSIDRSLTTLCGTTPPVGGVRYADLGGIDRGVVVRWSSESADLTPHGGPGVVRALLARLVELGVELDDLPKAEQGPESVLAALGRCRSPVGVDRLLRELAGGSPRLDNSVLARLWEPPLVAAIGPANVGKSSLLNAMAGRSVALAFDQPGVTRDAVGAELLLDGLVVRWLDTPGLGAAGGDSDKAAFALASGFVSEADLVLVCGDLASGWPEAELDGPVLRVALRTDLGDLQGSDVEVSVLDQVLLDRLARLIRARLVPDEVLWGGPAVGGAP